MLVIYPDFKGTLYWSNNKGILTRIDGAYVCHNEKNKKYCYYRNYDINLIAFRLEIYRLKECKSVRHDFI